MHDARVATTDQQLYVLDCVENFSQNTEWTSLTRSRLAGKLYPREAVADDCERTPEVRGRTWTQTPPHLQFGEPERIADIST